MAEIDISRPTFAKPRWSATVGASALHFDCSPTYVDKLEAEGIIQQQSDGFLLHQSRVAYLRYLQRDRR